MRKLRWALVAFALAGGISVSQADDNQSLADSVADRIEKSGRVSGYQLDIESNNGVVILSGHVGSLAQREDLVDMVRQVPGVLAVKDRVTVLDAATRAVAGFKQEQPVPVTSDTAQGAATESAPAANPVIEPEPVMNYAGGIAPYSDSPVLPPYAWPAYTPYNNFASMAYQTQYPAGAWPFIGPPHPYPMIPSGWRRVSLTWKKGYWWMKFHAH